MLGLRLTTKRELDLWKAVLLDLRERLKAAEAATDRERVRAEGAINALLAREARVTLPVGPQKPHADMEELLERAADIFGDVTEDEAQKKEAERKLMEDLQS